MLGEDLNAFSPPVTLDRDTQPQGKAANVDPAIPRWERVCQEYPEMSAATAFLKSRLHPLLPPVGLEGVSTAVDEEAGVIRHHSGGRIEAKPLHSLLSEVRWAGPLLHVGGEMIRGFLSHGPSGSGGKLMFIMLHGGDAAGGIEHE